MLSKILKINEIAELCEGVYCADLGENFQTHIYLQNFGSIQPRTSLVKYAASRDKPVDDSARRELRSGRRPAWPRGS